MKYVKIIDTDKGKLWVLNASENGIERNEFDNKNAYQRHIVDLMIQDVIGNYPIVHLDNGAPLIEAFPRKHISLSHSGEWIAVYWGDEPLGVDVQEMTKTLMDKRHYFVNIEEEAKLDITEKNLNLIWGAKEVLYKKRQGSIKNYKEDICIKQITKTSIEVLFNRTLYLFNYSLLDNRVVVYSV